MQIAAMILGILSLVPLSFLGVAGPVGFIGTGVALAAIVLAARTSILVVILLVAVLLAANIAMQVISAKRMENRHQMV